MDRSDAPAAGPSPGGPLRVGILVDSLVQPRWRGRVVAEIASSPIAQLALVVELRPNRRRRPNRLRRLISEWRHLLYHLYRALDDRLFRGGPDALDEMDISGLTHACATIEVGPFEGGGPVPLSDSEIKKIIIHNIDVVICLGLEPRSEDAPRIARYGVWAFRHGNHPVGNGEIAGVREVLEAQPMTTVALHDVAAGGDGRWLVKSFVKVDKRSIRCHCNHLCWTSSALVGRALSRLYNGAAPTEGRRDESASSDGGQPRRIPDNREMAHLLAQFAGRAVAYGLGQMLYRDPWILAYTAHDEEDAPCSTLARLRHLIPPKDRFWADPFPVAGGDRHYIFMEELIYRKQKAHIAVLEINRRGGVEGPRTVLERDYHLSYPFTFSYGGALYMVPETSGNRTVELYRCVEFPHRWELDRVLMDGVRAVDATLAEHGGRWWMFVNIAVDGAVYDFEDLHLFHAESPLGPWRPHRRNPVKSDVRSARPAGRLFRRGGAWYRPSQDCAKRYGYNIVINKIETWDIDEYAEVEVDRISPDWGQGVVTTHTINGCTGLTVIDGQIRRSRLF